MSIYILIYNKKNSTSILGFYLVGTTQFHNYILPFPMQAIAEGSKSSAVLLYEYEDSPADGQSVATTADDYRAVTSDLETVGSEDRFSRSSLSHSQQLSVAVNLASTEDITLEPEDQKVTYSHSSYSTTV